MTILAAIRVLNRCSSNHYKFLKCFEFAANGDQLSKISYWFETEFTSLDLMTDIENSIPTFC